MFNLLEATVSVPTLPMVWFILVTVLWLGYFFLEGFDYGVAMLIPVLGKNDRDKRVIVNTIGPVWDGNDLVQIGYAFVTMGQADKGIALIEQGIAKGGLKRPEDAKLRLGVAMLKSGKGKAKAMQVLRSVQGADGAADLGRVWALVSNQAS